MLCFGVFSANEILYNIQGNISYVIDDVFVEINTSLYMSTADMVLSEETLIEKSDALYQGALSGQISVVDISKNTNYVCDTFYSYNNNNFFNNGTCANLPINFGHYIENEKSYAYFVVVTIKNQAANDIHATLDLTDNSAENCYIISNANNLNISGNNEQCFVIAIALKNPGVDIISEDFLFSLNVFNGELQIPYIGSNSNWWIDGKDSGYNAISNGNGSISVHGGYYVINEVLTNIQTSLSASDLKYNSPDMFENDLIDGFVIIEETADNYDSLNWIFTGEFYGWAGSLGQIDNFDSIKFKIKAQSESTISQVTVRLRENSHYGIILYEDTLSVDINPSTEKEILWNIGETVTNNNNINYFFEYLCDDKCQLYGHPDRECMKFPDQYLDTWGPLGYYTKFTDYHYEPILTGGGEGLKYAYLPVQIGFVEPTCNIKQEETYALSNQPALPTTIYAYVGQTIQIYFTNIFNTSTDDLQIEVFSENRGQVLSDRWEYTPNSAEQFNLAIQANKNNQTYAKVSSLVIVKSNTSKQEANILVIGDSTVQAGRETSQMYSLSTSDSEFDIHLLGTKGTDNNFHEGRGGWTVNAYLTTQEDNPFYNPNKSCFDFEYYMTNQGYEDLDVVFIQLGINDIFYGREDNIDSLVDDFVLNMNSMISSIISYDSNIKVIINLIIPCDQNEQSFSETYGSTQTVSGFMRNMYKANIGLIKYFSNKENIYLSWYNACLDAVNNQGGNVHPNTDGYTQLGTQMYYFLKAII